MTLIPVNGKFALFSRILRPNSDGGWNRRLPLLDAFRNPSEEFRTEILTLRTVLKGAYPELAA